MGGDWQIRAIKKNKKIYIIFKAKSRFKLLKTFPISQGENNPPNPPAITKIETTKSLLEGYLNPPSETIRGHIPENKSPVRTKANIIKNLFSV